MADASMTELMNQMQINLNASISQQIQAMQTSIQASFTEQFGVLSNSVNLRLDDQNAAIAIQTAHLKSVQETVNKHSAAIAILQAQSRASSSTGPLNSRSYSFDKCRRWIGSFPRPLLASKRQAHFEQVKSQIMTDIMVNNVTPQFHRISQSYSLTFTSEALAKEFSEVFNNANATWQDPRDGGIHFLKSRTDLPKDVRTTQRALSRCWDPIIELFAESPKYTPQSKPIINGYKGTIHWTDGEDVWPLVTCTDVNRAAFTFDVDQPTCDHFVIDVAKLTTIMA
ncbi:unnamed protein product, partial [Prorocentrum cordatum]